MTKRVYSDHDLAEALRMSRTNFDDMQMLVIRSTAVIGARLEDKISVALRNGVTCANVTGDNLSTIVTLSYGLGIISEGVFRVLGELRRLRNKFAHSSEEAFFFEDFECIMGFLDPQDQARLAGALPLSAVCEAILLLEAKVLDSLPP